MSRKEESGGSAKALLFLRREGRRGEGSMAEGNNITAALEQIKNVKLNLSIDNGQVAKLRKSLRDDNVKKGI